MDKEGSDKLSHATLADTIDGKKAEPESLTMHEELEIRVKERTAELATANEALQAEIARRKRAEEELRLLLTVRAAIGESKDFRSALRTALRTVCAATGWEYGDAWVPQKDGTALDFLDAWHRKSRGLEEFRKFSENMTFPRGIGLPGHVWATKRPEWVRNAVGESEEKFPRVSMGMKAGLKAGLGVPIMADDEVLAVLGFFMSEPRAEDDRLVEIISAVAGQIGAVVRRKRAEEALKRAREELETRVRARRLQESEDRYHNLADATPVLIWQSGLDKLCMYFNKGWLEFTGRTMEQEQGNGWAEGVHPDDLQRCLDTYTSAFDRREPFVLEYRLRHHSGHYRWILDRGAPLLSSDGTFLGYIGGCIDIHDRKQAEQSQQRSEAWLHSLIETTQDAVISIDRQGRIVLFNPSAERIFGYSEAEVQGRKINLLMAEPYADEHDGYIARYEQTGERRAIGRIRTVAARRKSGEIFPIELSITEVMTAESEAVHYAAFIRDISEKTRLQETIVENERLATIGATMSVFAHEVGNPLNAMFMTVQLLERYLSRGEQTDEAATSAVKRLRNEIRRLNDLLEDFRSLSRREKYAFHPTSLAGVAREIFAMEGDNYKSRGILVEQDFPAALPPVVADEDRLKQALLNLSKNALEAMPNGGTLLLRAYPSEGRVVFEITDTGVGIPDGVDIFEPFTTTKSAGTGLGLMIVRQIVAAHGGTITYSSEPGKGTSFRLTLRPAAT